MSGDYIRLYRKSLDSKVFADDDLWRLWCWCLMKASWKKCWVDGREILPGQFCTSRNQAAMQLSVSSIKWYRDMQTLQSWGQIRMETNKLGTLVTICNWEVYQDTKVTKRTTSEQPMNNLCTTYEQPMNSLPYIEEEGKEGKDNTPDLFEEFWKAFPSGRKQGKGDARKAWASAIKKADPQFIISSAIEYAASAVGRGPYVKGPSPWLNQECWNDDRAAWHRNDSKPQIGSKPSVNLLSGFEKFAERHKHDG